MINGVHYVDGGLFHNFPVSIIREECERIIGVNVSPLVPQKYKQTIFHIAERSYHYMFRANTLEDREMCDVLIEAEEFEMAEQNCVMDCMECGTCAYICPAKRPLVQHFRRAKGEILARRRKK